MSPYLILCPLVFLAGFVDAIAGGGGLISLPAYLIAGLPAHDAIGTNKINSLMSAAASAGKLFRDGHTPGKLSVICAVVALLGSAVGASLALRLNAELFLRVMLIVLPLTALYALLGKGFQEKGETWEVWKRMAVALTSSFAVGVYDGFYGPGSGTFLILLLTGAARLRMLEANAVSKIVSVAANAAAFVMFLGTGHMRVGLGLCAGISGMVGSWLGIHCFERYDVSFVKWMILFVLALFFGKVVTDL